MLNSYSGGRAEHFTTLYSLTVEGLCISYRAVPLNYSEQLDLPMRSRTMWSWPPRRSDSVSIISTKFPTCRWQLLFNYFHLSENILLTSTTMFSKCIEVRERNLVFIRIYWLNWFTISFKYINYNMRNSKCLHILLAFRVALYLQSFSHTWHFFTLYAGSMFMSLKEPDFFTQPYCLVQKIN